jgi:hypothetical protein
MSICPSGYWAIEVVQADRWLKDNKNLKGDQLKAAVDKQSWDDSIKSLVASPDVLSMLSSKLSWTVKLGDAVLAQQPDLMDAVQRLRTRAEANNKLTSNKQQKVTKSPGPGGRQTIVVEQTDPDMLYVPYYDPAVVYGGWPYPDYPPYAFGYPPYIGAGLIATGLAFGAGWALGRWGAGGNYWGGGFNWNINNIKEFNAFTQEVGESLPILEEMGYEVAIFRVQWGLPPKAKLRLRSKGTINPTTLPAITAKASGGMLMTALISSAATAKQIQTTMKLGTAIIDVDFALPPKVRMSFLKANPDKKDTVDRNVEDLDLACGVALAN